MQHEVMLGTKLGAQPGTGGEHRRRGRAVSARASGNEPLERGQFVRRAVGEQPRGDVVIAMKLRERVRRAAVARRRNGSAPCCDEQLDHRHVPSSRSDVERRFAVWPHARFGSAPCSSSQRGPAGLVAQNIM